MAGPDIHHAHPIYSGTVSPCRLHRLRIGHGLLIFGKPLLVKLFHCDGWIQVVWVFVVLHQSLIGVIVGFKVRLRFQWLGDWAAFRSFSYGDHGTEGFSEVSVLNLANLSEAVGQASALVILIAGLSSFCSRLDGIAAMGAVQSFVADRKPAFRTLSEHK